MSQQAPGHEAAQRLVQDLVTEATDLADEISSPAGSTSKGREHHGVPGVGQQFRARSHMTVGHEGWAVHVVQSLAFSPTNR